MDHAVGAASAAGVGGVVESAPPPDPFHVEADGFEWARAEDMLAAAVHPGSSQEVLERLAGSSDPVFRAGVARNPSVSPGVLARLAGDKDR